jgi:signal transduction histidine kinase
MEIIKERLAKEEIYKQYEWFHDNIAIKTAFDSTNTLIAVINEFRQIVYANKALCTKLAIQMADILGRRPGEILFCTHSRETQYGCGGSQACENCSVVNTIIKAMETKTDRSDETVIFQNIDGEKSSFNSLVNVVPLSIRQEYFYVITMMDISDSIMRRMLERVFFHDILNTAGALKGLLCLMKEDIPEEFKEEVGFVEDTFQSLVDDIKLQRLLLEAENHELTTDIITAISTEILRSIIHLYEKHEVAEGKTIQLDKNAVIVGVQSDYVLLRRIMANMLKNALEATEKGETVVLGCDLSANKQEVMFWVHNTKVIPQHVQNQIFNKSFSTKGRGRGIGTYSMKLFGENYLKGTVGFVSEENQGTKFYFITKLCEESI